VLVSSLLAASLLTRSTHAFQNRVGGGPSVRFGSSSDTSATYYGGKETRTTGYSIFGGLRPTTTITSQRRRVAAASVHLYVGGDKKPTNDSRVDALDVMSQDYLLHEQQQQQQQVPDIASPPLPLILDPSNIEIVPESDPDTITQEDNPLDQASPSIYPFVEMLRGSATYMADHRGTNAVFHIPGQLIDTKEFPVLIDDLALCWLLGIKIVIVVGSRQEMEECQITGGDYQQPSSSQEDLACHSSIRITNSQELRLIEEEAGYVRFEIERQLNRCLRLHGGFVAPEPGVTPPPNGNVVGGNFYSAMAFGQRDGIDYKHAGFPCHVQTEKIRQSLGNNDILLLTGVGMSRMGEMLSVNTEALAAFVAGEIQASKVVYFSTKGMLLRNKSTKNSVQNFQLSFATSLLDHYKVQIHKKGYASVNEHSPEEDGIMNSSGVSKDDLDLLLKIGWAASALKRGVQRAHIIAQNDGDLLTELFTACDGKSTCISPDGFRSIHPDDEFDDIGNFDGTWFQEFVNGNPPYS